MTADKTVRIRPEAWDDFAVFRETFLSQYLSVEDASAFRAVGCALFNAVLANQDREPPRESVTYLEVRTAVEDLHHMVGYLEHSARFGSSELDPADVRLARVARRQARVLERVAGRLAAALGLGPPQEAEPEKATERVTT